MLYQDASAVAAGGGLLELVDGRLVPASDLFLAEFDEVQSKTSSTYRELVGILWCLIATAHVTKHRIVFACDNWQSVNAIKRGSRNPIIQAIAEKIFRWCLNNNKVFWHTWLHRTDMVIKEGDRRSRLSIPHGDRSPQAVIVAANELAMIIWHQEISFDQAASHRSAIRIRGKRIPFNAFCMQPGAAGVDTFRCWDSWSHNINYVYPPAPMTGRLASFLPTTKAKTILSLIHI